MKNNFNITNVLIVFIILIVGINYINAQPIYQGDMLTASDNGNLDQFGASVDIYEETIVVGSVYDDTGNKKNHGSAYVYEKGENGWQQKIKLVASDIKAVALFGCAVGIYENTIIVGALGDNSGGQNSGAAYIFVKDNTGNWVQQSKLIPDDLKEGLGFGFDVAIYGDYAIVGALDFSTNINITGNAYIFHKNKGGQNNWGQVKKITASGNEIGNWFGYSVDIDDGIVIVGAWKSSLNGDNSGLAYIYEKNNGGNDNWGQLKVLKPEGLDANFNFGYSIDIDQDKAIIGATGADLKGSAYIFQKDKGGSNNWGELLKLKPDNGKFNDNYGFSVSIYGDDLIIGSIRHYREDGSGVVYIYNKDMGGADKWGLVSEVIPDDPSDRGAFGCSVSLFDGNAIIGARTKSIDFDITGAAFIFGPPLPNIVTQPISVDSVCFGAEQVFSVIGENIAEYQWRVKYEGTDVWVKVEDNNIFSGSKTSTLTVTTTKALNNSSFSCKVSNENGYEYSTDATLTLETIAPVISSTHSDQTVTANENCKAILNDYTSSLVTTDNCSSDLEISQSPEEGTKIEGDVNKVVMTVTDKVGNSSKVEFNVSVVDSTKPLITCIESKTVRMESGGSYYSVKDTEFDPLTLSDNCAIENTINDFNNSNTLSGSQLPFGKTSILWTTTDKAGNKNDCTFEIDVKYPTSVGKVLKDEISRALQ